MESIKTIYSDTLNALKWVSHAFLFLRSVFSHQESEKMDFPMLSFLYIITFNEVNSNNPQ